ncbi:hypothetical protein [Spiroplasma endosymbiont of Dioctria linearis]|uniref:hypothetical protein n=1 Tax=Spiroplasma endosymbiont of Dioctria linearis TaxID=3066290 RepID=UPI00313EBB9F
MSKMICLLWIASIGSSGAIPIISNVLIEERQVETNYRSEFENEIFIDLLQNLKILFMK